MQPTIYLNSQQELSNTNKFSFWAKNPRQIEMITKTNYNKNVWIVKRSLLLLFIQQQLENFILSRRHHKVTLFLVYLFYFLLFEWNVKGIFLNNICNYRCKARRSIKVSIWKEYMIKYSDIPSFLVISGMVAIFSW